MYRFDVLIVIISTLFITCFGHFCDDDNSTPISHVYRIGDVIYISQNDEIWKYNLKTHRVSERSYNSSEIFEPIHPTGEHICENMKY